MVAMFADEHAPARSGVLIHVCGLCDRFRVEEPRLEIRSEWGDDGTIRIKVARYGWELPLVQHLYEEHPAEYAAMFPAMLLSDALLLTAARAEASLKEMINAQVAGFTRR